MTITRVGSNEAYADGWAKAFGSGKSTKKTTAKATPAKAAAKPAAKAPKATKKKAVKKNK
ncbi:MAG: hypothetical protein R3C05_00455 [Pirellulaceae bacterium]